ncbi:hypothetical protein [Ralstonia pickettii]|uniref:hypothetical protein n=1 Tax=Ralstonia pickettii TaxID=329 RepID=UPI0011126921|nr:hypothetical protein [Ralstonia pickettii]
MLVQPLICGPQSLPVVPSGLEESRKTVIYSAKISSVQQDLLLTVNRNNLNGCLTCGWIDDATDPDFAVPHHQTSIADEQIFESVRFDGVLHFSVENQGVGLLEGRWSANAALSLWGMGAQRVSDELTEHVYVIVH